MILTESEDVLLFEQETELYRQMHRDLIKQER